MPHQKSSQNLTPYILPDLIDQVIDCQLSGRHYCPPSSTYVSIEMLLITAIDLKHSRLKPQTKLIRNLKITGLTNREISGIVGRSERQVKRMLSGATGK